MDAIKTFTVDRSVFGKRFTVTPPPCALTKGETEADASHSLVRAGAFPPMLTMHAGLDVASPVIAVSRLPLFSKHFTIGLGDASLDAPPDRVCWEDMRMANRSGTSHRWSLHLPTLPLGSPRQSTADTSAMSPQTSPPHGRRDGERKSFLWKRTRHVAVDGMNVAAWRPQNYKLVEEEPPDVLTKGGDCHWPRVLAVFTSTGGKAGCGRLQLNVQCGPVFETMVIMTCLTLLWAGR
ncbi:hypothetical protein DCS_03229 [Drechmeria coniospora]|uniref:Uncharacterized protein n=1 Tax=Drechmeria coniospora TaxID=98403 RepID=A0A151GYA7_DRECN|nr:hypothetical protein DCS_03229 [Drechmeria coniospora]KYK62084.1 hypothetical protein DCS_03229 [Drechmeria coniospora]